MSVRPVSAPTDGAVPEPVIAAPSLAAVPSAHRSRRGAAWRSLLRTPSAVVGLVVALFWVVCAIFWPLFVPYNPDYQDFNALLTQPSWTHLFGTDQLGRDVLSRVLAGSRDVLMLAPPATLIGLLGGAIIGLVTTYYGGWVDEIVMRVMDAIMAFPFIIL